MSVCGKVATIVYSGMCPVTRSTTKGGSSFTAWSSSVLLTFCQASIKWKHLQERLPLDVYVVRLIEIEALSKIRNPLVVTEWYDRGNLLDYLLANPHTDPLHLVSPPAQIYNETNLQRLAHRIVLATRWSKSSLISSSRKCRAWQHMRRECKYWTCFIQCLPLAKPFPPLDSLC